MPIFQLQNKQAYKYNKKYTIIHGNKKDLYLAKIKYGCETWLLNQNSRKNYDR